MPPSVSVVVPAFNAAGFIGRALENVLNQTVPVLEIIVVDDGSTDDTATVASRYGPLVRVARKSNAGPASARNLGASLARGEWLAMLDADDWWYPRKNELQLRHSADPGIGMSHCRLDHRPEHPPAELTFEGLWERNWISNSSVLIRKAIFDQLDGFVEEKRLISVEDYNLWLRVAAAGWRVVVAPHVLVHYTQGIGISADPGRLMGASLYNVDDLEKRLGLSADMAERKRQNIRASFRRQALREAEPGPSRALLRRMYREAPGIETGLHAAVGVLAAPALMLKRAVVRQLRANMTGQTRVTLEDPRESEYAEVRVPVKETPFWSGGEEAGGGDEAFHCTGAEALPVPMLVTTIDAEEDFDWHGPFVRTSARVTSMRSQHKAHRVFERHGVIPLYLADFPVATRDDGRAPLRELLDSKQCEVGAQLHPWVNPPFVEVISGRNSYPGNLPMVLEYDKIGALTGALEDAFGTAPQIYRAGRYGFGPNTAGILRHFGYLVDSSVMPHWNYSAQGEPDFRGFPAEPSWIGPDRAILEMPISVGLVGRAARLGPAAASALFNKISEGLGVTAAAARLGLLERIRLTPEGIAIEEAKRLVRHMLANGQRVFVMTYHSPSMEPGGTPYVRTAEDLVRFLAWLDEFYAFFTREIGGKCVGWRDVRDSLLKIEPPAPRVNQLALGRQDRQASAGKGTSTAP